MNCSLEFQVYLLHNYFRSSKPSDVHFCPHRRFSNKQSSQTIQSIMVALKVSKFGWKTNKNKNKTRYYIWNDITKFDVINVVVRTSQILYCTYHTLNVPLCVPAELKCNCNFLGKHISSHCNRLRQTGFYTGHLVLNYLGSAPWPILWLFMHFSQKITTHWWQVRYVSYW